QAVAFSALDLDVHLEPAAQQMAVRALLTVRNDGKTPLKHIPLQISSSLNWERIRVGGHDVPFQVSTLNSDADHTGQLHEAAVPFAQPLAPGASVVIDATYSGTIVPSAQRLVALGMPEDQALRSDWDEIGTEFTGLRGFGNVVWYPVASVPAVLGMSEATSTLHWQAAGAANVDSARLFDEIGEHKLRLEGAHFKLRVTDEFPRGQAPTVAVINGESVPLNVTNGTDEVPGVATAALESETLGFEAPSLFVAIRKPVQATDATLWTQPGEETAVTSWTAADTAVMPFVQGWLGQHPRSQLTILDLPDEGDAPFESAALLAAPIRQAAADQLDDVMIHSLTHAFLCTGTQTPPAWLDEGVARFMGTLWLEKQAGRTKALESLEADRQALALAEPSSPGESAGQPLRQAIAPTYYRTKAAYVLWMLRDLVGDTALSAALQGYDPAADQKRNGGPGEFETLLERNAHRDLKWFFADWVDADKGLPDLTIDSVFPTAAQAGNTLVGVDLSNAGYAAADVPVTVRTAENSITQRVMVPGRGKVVQRILIQGKPTSVQANDGTIPETQASEHVTDLTAADSSSSAGQPGVPQ
ncbi:MAG TPA: hypothetical protein VL991_12705, partial [Terracidiphilus sp.]|nr:hypothetical protein [Terracidiphilus sp.]